jgi:hypothetical protein
MMMKIVSTQYSQVLNAVTRDYTGFMMYASSINMLILIQTEVTQALVMLNFMMLAVCLPHTESI